MLHQAHEHLSSHLLYYHIVHDLKLFYSFIPIFFFKTCNLLNRSSVMRGICIH